ncbi:MAG: hypothetical protein ACLP50_02010 [Solirubrobacteraceae bacterium]
MPPYVRQAHRGRDADASGAAGDEGERHGRDDTQGPLPSQLGPALKLRLVAADARPVEYDYERASETAGQQDGRQETRMPAPVR